MVYAYLLILYLLFLAEMVPSTKIEIDFNKLVVR